MRDEGGKEGKRDFLNKELKEKTEIEFLQLCRGKRVG